MTTFPARPQVPAKASLGHRLASTTAALTRPLAGRRFFPLWGVVHHRGRKSGRAMSIPVVVRKAGDGVLIPLPWGPKTNWVRNVIAAGGCTITWKGAERAYGLPTVIPMADSGTAFGGFQRRISAKLGIENCLTLQPETSSE